MKTLAAIACEHKNTVKTDSDTVCSACGMVVDELEYSIEGMHDSGRSRMNLFETKAVGSKNDLPKTRETLRLRQYYRGSVKNEVQRSEFDILSKFSNTSEKLGLSKPAREYAWMRFLKAMPTQSRRKLAETACWAIYESTKTHALQITIDEIKEAILLNFNRKKLPNMISILYHNMDNHVGADPSNDEMYYFKINLKKLLHDKKYSKKGYAKMYNNAWVMYRETYVRGNHNQRAKRAIANAFGIKT